METTKKKTVSRLFQMDTYFFKFNQDVLIFFDSGYRLKSEWLFTKVWTIEDEPKPNPLLMVYSNTNWSKPDSNSFVVSHGILNSDGKEL